MNALLDKVCDPASLYVLGASIGVGAMALLLAVAIAIVALRMNSRVRISEADAMAEPFGDQSRPPHRWRP